MTITLTQEDADTILAYLRGQLSEENRVYALMKATAITGFPDSKTMIERLREQIEKMKCCYNCKKWDCAILECKNDEARIPTCAAYCCDKWEMNE